HRKWSNRPYKYHRKSDAWPTRQSSGSQTLHFHQKRWNKLNHQNQRLISPTQYSLQSPPHCRSDQMLQDWSGKKVLQYPPAPHLHCSPPGDYYTTHTHQHLVPRVKSLEEDHPIHFLPNPFDRQTGHSHRLSFVHTLLRWFESLKSRCRHKG